MKKQVFRKTSSFMAVFMALSWFGGVCLAGPLAWAPCKGKVKISTINIINYFTFPTKAFRHFHDSKYNFIHTYEHETHTSKGWAKLDKYRYWSSNMPHAYLDTQASDWRSDVDNYAVGTLRAILLASGKEYYTALTIQNTKSSATKIKVKGQWGKVTNKHLPLTDPWQCLFPIETVSLATTYGPRSSYFSWGY